MGYRVAKALASTSRPAAQSLMCKITCYCRNARLLRFSKSEFERVPLHKTCFQNHLISQFASGKYVDGKDYSRRLQSQKPPKIFVRNPSMARVSIHFDPRVKTGSAANKACWPLKITCSQKS